MLVSSVGTLLSPHGSTGPETGADVETGYAPVEGSDRYYRTAGDGPPLVFVHAGIADGRLWRRQLGAFADRYRVLAYDLRGYGNSDLPPRPYAHYRDLSRLRNALEIDAAHLVGASMGDAVGLDFALASPDRVRSLTVVAPAHRTLVHSMGRRSYEHRTEDAPETELSPPAIDRLDEVTVPVFLVSGALDRPDMATIAATLARGLPDVRTRTIADAGHLPSLEKPAEFDERLASFLDGVRTEGS